MNLEQLATTLTTELRLERPPVGLAFVAEPPPGVPLAPTPVPSACTFWRLAQERVFYAPADVHLECPIGMLTMGFELPSEHLPRADELIQTMTALEYLDTAEIARLPAVRRGHRGIVYGPLAQLPLAPDVVILQVTPVQAMLLAEADGSSALAETPGLATMGRPACAALAHAVTKAAATLSLGCIGARTYVELPDERALLVLPAASLERTVARLPVLARANAELARHHQAQKARHEPRV